MTQDEKVNFLIDKTCTLIAGRLANENCKLLPAEIVKEQFENTYKALASEFKKSYVQQSVK